VLVLDGAASTWPLARDHLVELTSSNLMGAM